MAWGLCKGWTTAHPLAVVCWLCGKSHEECVNQFGGGHVRIKDEWEHIGVRETQTQANGVWVAWGTPHGVMWMHLEGFRMHCVTNMVLQKKERQSGSSSMWTP